MNYIINKNIGLFNTMSDFILQPIKYNKKITYLIHQYIQDTDLDDYIDLYQIQNYKQLLDRFDYRIVNNLIFHIYNCRQNHPNQKIHIILDKLHQELLTQRCKKQYDIQNEYDMFIENFEPDLFIHYLKLIYKNIHYLNHYLLQLPKLNMYTNQDFILWRGISNQNHLPTQIGETYIHPSFMSTTLYPEIAYKFTNCDILFKIIIPKHKLNIFPFSYINHFDIEYKPCNINQYISELYNKYGTSVPEIVIPLYSNFTFINIYQTQFNVFNNYQLFDKIINKNIKVYELLFVSFL